MSLINSISGLQSQLENISNLQPKRGIGKAGQFSIDSGEGMGAAGSPEALERIQAAKAAARVGEIDPTRASERAAPIQTGASGYSAPTFGQLVENLVDSVNAKDKASRAEAHKVLSGQTDNLHQSMIVMQEAGVAFNLLTEVRNKLQTSYQELLKMAG